MLPWVRMNIMIIMMITITRPAELLLLPLPQEEVKVGMMTMLTLMMRVVDKEGR